MPTATAGQRKLRKSFKNIEDRNCLGSHLSVSGGPWKAVEEAIELEIRALQIFTKNASRWVQKPIDPKHVEKFHAAVEEWGAHPLLSHDSYLINLASPKEELFQKSIAAFADELERAELLGLDFLVMHPGAHVGSGVGVGGEKGGRRLRRRKDEQVTVRQRTCHIRKAKFRIRKAVVSSADGKTSR